MAEKHTIGAVLVVGGGIAGMQASLDLAEMGFKVYLADEKGWIGGAMAGLDKTFPTNDCAMCIMSPKLVDAGRHPNITILPLSRLEKISGEPGNFCVTVKRLARYVDAERCNGCGECAETCPVSVPDSFNEGLSTRKAIYRLYPQAIPAAFAVEKEGRKSPCRPSCPAGLNVHGYVALIANKDFGRALKLIRERLPFPRSLGRICHHPCEDSCNRREVDESVSICALKRFVADREEDVPETDRKCEGEPRPERIEAEKAAAKKRERRMGKKAAVVGAGPAGLTAAADLASLGYAVTVFEREKEAGGMLRYGIPAYRLPRDVLASEIGRILTGSIKLVTGCEVGCRPGLRPGGRDADSHLSAEALAEAENRPTPSSNEISLSEIRETFAAVLIATGAQRGKKISVSGMKDVSVQDGVDLLRKIARGERIETGKSPIVIGGGNVAIDVARSLKRLGASSVKIACLESHRLMPAHLHEVRDALEEGIELFTSVGPRAVVHKGGRIEGLSCAACRTTFDEEGRFRPDLSGKGETLIPGDAIIMAVGQEAETAWLDGAGAIEGKHPRVDGTTLALSESGIFAAGDFVLGPASAVEAIGQGHEAALSIDRYLLGEDLRAGRSAVLAETAPLPSRPYRRLPRADAKKLPPDQRVRSFSEYAEGLSEEEAVEEASRCLNCSVCSECFRCVESCGRDAVVHDLTDRTEEIAVGAVILAPGYRRYDPSRSPEYGWGRLPNVLTSPQFERLLSASGPTGGKLFRPSDQREPKRIAFIQCVGSREEKEGNRYCSSVCCMYAIKEAVIAQEHAPGVECHIYFMDLRAFGKDFERYYNRAKEEHGVVFRRARMPRVEAGSGGSVVLNFLDEKNAVAREAYDLVVLSVGLEPAESLPGLASVLGAPLGEEGFLGTEGYDAQSSPRKGVFVCGAAGEPKDIPESVGQASAAAARAAELLASAKGSLTISKEYPVPREIADEEPRVGVFICRCGINIGGVVDVPSVAAYAKTLPGVAYAEENLYTCSQDTQQRLKEVILREKLNRVLVASCTPRTHEVLFQDTLREAGLNPYLFEFVGIREQCSWVHMHKPLEATEKAKRLVAMGVSRARQLVPVTLSSFPVNPSALVIGGGAAGMTAALSLAGQGFQTHLIEKEKELGGNARRIRFDLDGRDPQAFLAGLQKAVETHPKIVLHRGSVPVRVGGYVGNFTTTVRGGGEETEIAHGAIVVATGAEEYKPGEYLYGRSKNVLTQKELEERLGKGEAFERVAMIQCVGSRDTEHPYCSRVCCLTAVKNALKIKEMNPRAEIYILYRDLRTYGFSEVYYQRAREAGVVFLRYEEERKPSVREKGGKIRVAFHNYLLERDVELEVSTLVLSAGIVMPESVSDLSRMLKVPLSADRMFLEAHAKLRPLDFSSDGIYLCGLAHGPKSLKESVSQGLGAAARAATLLSRQEIQARSRPARLQERACSGCGLCVEICPFDARELDAETGKAKVIEVLCQGCGACLVACPNASSRQEGFEKSQLLAMIDAAT
jgi:heterodisulfide reductase subunit A-like polyferredoxin